MSSSLYRAYRAISLGLIAAAAVAGAGCGGHGASQRQAVHVTEGDFHISASPRRVLPGDVRLVVHNLGPVEHELIVVRSHSPHLPFRTDDVTVSEERIQHEIAGALEPGPPGAVRDLDLHLAPGRYELICNMAGHYLNGMSTSLVVE